MDLTSITGNVIRNCRFFLPDVPVDAEVKYKDNLMNAYDNSIRYTDNFLARIVHLLEEQQVDASMLLHVRPWGSYLRRWSRPFFFLHPPFRHIISYTYLSCCGHPTVIGKSIPIEKAASMNRQKKYIFQHFFFQTMMELAGIETPYRNDSLSVTSPLYTEKSRVYLNDHNEPRPLDDIGMRKEDFEMLKKKRYRRAIILFTFSS